MKTILIISMLLFASLVNAATYYVSNSGNDSNSGLTTAMAWQTMAKVNSTTFNAGDQILFKKGDTFYGTLTTISTGSSGSTIIYGAYSTGANPIITGFTTITEWVNEGNGIYSKIITSEAQTNMVTVDGLNIAMGRYPNTGYLTFESHNTNISITDSQLINSPNWTGAEVVIRKQAWIINRNPITDHTNGTLTYSGGETTPSDNYGYFIQNNLKTLDQFGEWYHDTTTRKFYMYFGIVNPTTKTVKVATLNNLFKNTVAQSYLGKYITIENVDFQGSISDAIYIPNWWTDHNTISSCSIYFAGQRAVFNQSSYLTIQNCAISDCATGIFMNREITTITDNTLTNIGIIVGQTSTYPNAIQTASNSHLIEGNSITNTGKHGISVANATNITVINNFINASALVFSDAGGIYTGDAYVNGLIDGNVVLNTYGNNDGTNNGGRQGEGIYLDEYSSGLTVQNNTVANCSGSGIKLHKAHDNNILNNTFYNNLTQIEFLSSDGTTSIVNNVVTGNQFISKSANQLALQCISYTNDISGFGIFNGNYYARPIDDNLTIYTTQPNAQYQNRTFAGWQSYSGQDANSQKTPQTILSESDFQFEYNTTTVTKPVTLTGARIDIKGQKYATSTILLQPFTSIVLMSDANPSQTSNPEGKKIILKTGSKYYINPATGKIRVR